MIPLSRALSIERGRGVREGGVSCYICVMYHTTVLRDEVVALANSVSRLSVCIDATLGDGGHSLALLQQRRRVRVIGVDCDRGMLTRAKERLHKYRRRIRYVHDHYDDYLARYEGKEVGFVLFDLGVSMSHMMSSGRGFTFVDDQPLDMRLDDNQRLRGADIVNEYPQQELQRIFLEYGGERHAGRIAAAIVAKRRRKKITSTAEFTRVVVDAIPPVARRRTVHPATQAFQALRIAVNDELTRLDCALPRAIEVAGRGGVVAAISFHSGEDRIVKQCFRSFEQSGTVVATHKKGMRASAEEVRTNRAARSATLRAVRKV